uniref:Hemicentin-2 n=1 Tax=Syphacia muris TaxID=451379 RepID=A0A0N5AV26_9BILA
MYAVLDFVDEKKAKIDDRGCEVIYESAYLLRPKIDPYYVDKSDDGPILECAFSSEYLNRTRYEPSWTAVFNGHPKLLTRSDDNFARDFYELIQNDDQYSLKLRSVDYQRNNGQYFCTILDKETGHQESASADVVVLVPPEKPIISDEPTAHVTENDFVTVECRSSFGNPPPMFRWKFSNNTEIPEQWYQVKLQSSSATSVSTLQWRVSSFDNGEAVICEIWNKALPEGHYYEASSKPLNVFYRPKVLVGPVNEYNVEEGGEVEVTCSADGNPTPTKFEWNNINTGERYEAAIWTFTAEKRNSGELRCKATNRVDSGYGTLKLNVLYAPVISVQDVYTPIKGDSLVMNCTTDSNPSVDTVYWQLPNGTKHNDSILRISSVSRTDSGNYTCFATNILTVHGNPPRSYPRTSSAVSTVNVRSKPGRAAIHVSERVIITGTRVVLTCNVSDLGSPKAQYRWTSHTEDDAYHGIEQASNYIVIEHASLKNSGEYYCTPFNEIGDGEGARYLLQVIEPPKIITPLPETKNLNGENPTLYCEAEGYPAPEIRWLKNGFDITDTDNTQWSFITERNDESCSVGKYCSVVVSSRMEFLKPLKWSDKGVYTCIAKNTAEDLAAESTSRISVFHNPVILNEKYPNESLAAAENSDTARITCSVSANPTPRIEWSRGDENLFSGTSRYAIHTTAVVGKVDEFESVLEISDLNEGDYGPYICRAYGDTGAEAEVVINLQSKSRPQLLKTLRLFATSSTWLLIGWQPGFNGGEQQKFQIEYRKTNPWKDVPEGAEPVAFYASSHNISSVILYGDNKKFGMRYRRNADYTKFLVYNLTNLQPLSNYWIRMRAKNSLGESDWTPILTAVTGDVAELVRLPRPQSLVYNTNEKSIGFQDPEMNGLCLLLLVNNEQNPDTKEPNWRLAGCYPESPILNIESANQFRARFCLQQNISMCSKPADIIVTATLLSSAWKYALPGAVVALSLVLLSLTFLVCCFLRKYSVCGKKKLKSGGALFEKKKPDVSVPLPQSDGKNAVVHGSHSDSGIFTLGSLPNNQPAGQQNVNGAPENNVPFDGTANEWCENDQNEFNNDPYIQEYSNGQYVAAKDAFPGPPPIQGGNFFYDGFTPCDGQAFGEQQNSIDGFPATIYEDQEDSDETTCSVSGGRRVMREIIV